LITTDPRGVGCNAPESPDYYPAQFYSSVNFADDVIALIEDRQLDNYIVYGISYGTLLGTLLASRIEERGLPPPRALVLEGVLGQAFTPDTPADYLGFQERWRDVRDRLEPSIREQLMADPLPGGLSAEQWGAAIAAALPRGASPITGGDDYMYTLLSIYLSPTATAEQRAELPAIIEEMGASPVDDMGLRLHTEVTCREIAENEYVSLALVDGELVPVEFDCEDVALSDAFSAAEWPVHVPIYYFSGSQDPSTPPWQARSHFDAQTGAPRQLVHVLGASHNPLVLNLSDCAEPLWQAMATGSGFDTAAAGCQWPVEVETAAAE
jgi:pimeloyl-ACP methyl ester carboxylesterase